MFNEKKNVKKNKNFHPSNSLFSNIWTKNCFFRAFPNVRCLPHLPRVPLATKSSFFPSKTHHMLPRNDPWPLKIFFSESRPILGGKKFWSLFTVFDHTLPLIFSFCKFFSRRNEQYSAFGERMMRAVIDFEILWFLVQLLELWNGLFLQLLWVFLIFDLIFLSLKKMDCFFF